VPELMYPLTNDVKVKNKLLEKNRLLENIF